jgi:hypothetical protein
MRHTLWGALALFGFACGTFAAASHNLLHGH